MREHSKEGNKLIRLLKNEENWEYKKYWDGLIKYDCLQCKKSNFVLVPVNGIFFKRIYAAVPKGNYSIDIWMWDKSFFTKKDHKVLYKIVSKIIDQILNPTVSKNTVSNLIMNANSNCLS